MINIKNVQNTRAASSAFRKKLKLLLINCLLTNSMTTSFKFSLLSYTKKIIEVNEDVDMELVNKQLICSNFSFLRQAKDAAHAFSTFFFTELNIGIPKVSF